MRIEHVGFVAVVMLAIACSEGANAPSDADSPQAAAIQRGRKIYENVCIACHNADPAQPGSLGPQVAGASRELIEAKVLRGEYPPGYTPVRPGQTMPKYEYLADRLDDLVAYLQQD
jgi:ubiquinol-cytochrome c reductase cytochrome c subunit